MAFEMLLTLQVVFTPKDRWWRGAFTALLWRNIDTSILVSARQAKLCLVDSGVARAASMNECDQ